MYLVVLGFVVPFPAVFFGAAIFLAIVSPWIASWVDRLFVSPRNLWFGAVAALCPVSEAMFVLRLV